MREIKFNTFTLDGTELNITLNKKEFETSISLLNKLAIIFENLEVPNSLIIGKKLNATSDFLQEMYEKEFNNKERKK